MSPNTPMLIAVASWSSFRIHCCFLAVATSPIVGNLKGKQKHSMASTSHTLEALFIPFESVHIKSNTCQPYCHLKRWNWNTLVRYSLNSTERTLYLFFSAIFPKFWTAECSSNATICWIQFYKNCFRLLPCGWDLNSVLNSSDAQMNKILRHCLLFHKISI